MPPRQMTQEEVQERFMQQLATYVHYWANVKDPQFASVEQKLSALAFGFLNMLDGTSMGLPAFEVVPSPHPLDKAYNQSEGKNWWPQDPLPEGTVTVHGQSMLHELWNKYDPFPVKSSG
jgi:hypothetical protein